MVVSDFKSFAEAVSRQFAKMVETGTLFRTDAEKEILWETYLESYPEGTNNIVKERREYDCNSCKSFIRAAGGIITFKPEYRTTFSTDDIMTVWDLAMELTTPEYRTVAAAMREYVLSRSFSNIFLSPEPVAGVQKHVVQLESGGVMTWHHFFVNFPREVVCKGEDIGTRLAEVKSTYDVALRGLSELKLDALDTVLELIAQNSLYRGQEHQVTLSAFRTIKVEFDKIPSHPGTTNDKQRNFCAMLLGNQKPLVLRVRNTSIGQLLINLSEGMDLEIAVKKFEEMVAPANYKRPTALITNSMIERARAQCEELGLTSALDRRHAVLADIKASDIIFADRSMGSALQTKNGFDALQAGVADKMPKNLDKVEEIPIERFITDVVPKAEAIEIMFESRLTKNLFSLIAPCDLTAGRLFNWRNNFSWSYNGDLTDSAIRERVKQAGGNVTGELCFRLAWSNTDDLDFHLKEPGNYEISFQNKARLSPCGGMLDVDMNVNGETRTPVENIFYETCDRMAEGIYLLYVHQYTKRDSHDIGFDIEVDYKGEVQHMSFADGLKNKESVGVMKFKYSRANGFEIIESLPLSSRSQEIWGINTQKFHPVSLAMFSPNYWEDSGSNVGNKHYMFIVDGCNNPTPTRGFFNEFLRGDLHDHRKVFEVLGSKMKAEPAEKQLSGLGFSSTIRESAVFRVKGSFNRVVKVTF